MEALLCQNEQMRCSYHTSNDETPLIEIKDYPEGSEETLYLANSKVVIVLEGELWYSHLGTTHYESLKEQIVFFPASHEIIFKAVKRCLLILLRIDQPSKICDNFTLKDLFEQGKPLEICNNGNAPISSKRSTALEIIPTLWSFMNDLRERISSGIRCKRFFELKIKEFFIMLHTYYSKEQLYFLLHPILSNDTLFSEQVRLRWRECKTVNGLAGSMHLSTKQFSEKFKAIFGKTPYRWMVEEKAKVILEALLHTDMTIKQISIENDFNTMAQFSNFCKTELGKYPTEIRQKMKSIDQKE